MITGSPIAVPAGTATRSSTPATRDPAGPAGRRLATPQPERLTQRHHPLGIDHAGLVVDMGRSPS